MKDYPEFFEGDSQEKRLSKCFLLLGVAAYLGVELSEARSYLTDGGNDGGFDAVYIEELPDSILGITLFQAKYSRDLEKERNFPVNALEKAINAVTRICDPNIQTKLNTESQKAVDDIHSLLLDGYIPQVTCVMVSNTAKWLADGDLLLSQRYAASDQVRFIHYGYQEILGFIQGTEPINTQLAFKGNSIHDSFSYKQVIMGKVAVGEIARLMSQFGDRLLEKNIRHYLGQNEINQNIAKCLEDENERLNFFFYNNGITMICTHFAFNGLQERDWIVKLNGLQIINGAQTCRTILDTVTAHPETDFSAAYVLVRIYEVSDDAAIVNQITYATNHQNPVDRRDLRSNDQYQSLLEIGAKDLGYKYKRKRDNLSAQKTAIPALVAAEAVLAVWRLCPHLAKYKKAELFGSYYEMIFRDLNAAQMIMAVLIFRACDAYRKKNTTNDELAIVRYYGSYFLACVVGGKLQRETFLELEKLTHKNFESVRDHFNRNKERLCEYAERKLLDALKEYYSLKDGELLTNLDGRTLAAAFRRYDLIEKYIKDKTWWKD